MLERYKKIETIGSGAQSIVYKVEDTKENNEMYIYFLYTLIFNYICF